MSALYLLLAKSHVQFTFLTSFQRISPSSMFCEILLNAVSCYGVELLATRPTTKLEDTPCRKSAVVYSEHYQIPFIGARHLLHRNLRTRRTVMTWMHLVWLMIHCNYHHHLVFSVAVSVTQDTHSLTGFRSIINALMSLILIDSLMTFSPLLIPY